MSIAGRTLRSIRTVCLGAACLAAAAGMTVGAQETEWSTEAVADALQETEWSTEAVGDALQETEWSTEAVADALQETELNTVDGMQESEGAEATVGTAESQSVYNILLIGSDRRDESWNGNSDVMIMVTINQNMGKLFLTSFMRDLYAEIPGYGVHKLNYAYAAGGADTLIATLEDNYKLKADYYAVVDFETMAEIVDLVGGAQMEVSDAECEVLNGYLTSMNAEEDYLPGGGTYVLNGHQAVAYMRIRYVGNSDYQRTQRQRDVLSTIFASMQKLNAADLTKLVETVTEKTKHNIDAVSMLRLMAMLPEVKDYELEENRIPYDGLYTSRDEMLVPDFAETVQRLHETVYGSAAE